MNEAFNVCLDIAMQKVLGKEAMNWRLSCHLQSYMEIARPQHASGHFLAWLFWKSSGAGDRPAELIALCPSLMIRRCRILDFTDQKSLRSPWVFEVRRAHESGLCLQKGLVGTGRSR